jgi:hypothetical protein
MISLGFKNTNVAFDLTFAAFYNFKAQGQYLRTTATAAGTAEFPSALKDLVDNTPLNVPLALPQPQIYILEYEVTGPVIDEDPHHASMTPVCPPLVDLPNAVPVSSPNQDAATIEYRIDAPKNSAVPPESYFQFAADFISIFPEMTPLPLDELAEHFKKPKQLLALDRYCHSDISKVQTRLSSFMKAESYPKFRDARNITNVNDEFKIGYSQFTVPIGRFLKTKRWYAFGHTPEVVASRVHDLAKNYGFFQATDFSSYDATHSAFFVWFEQCILERCYGTEAASLSLEQYHNVCYTKHGIPYNVENTRITGSPDTSIFNTIDNAFVAYVCYRLMDMDHDQALDHLGLYGGDDGLSCYTDEKLPYSSVCASLGLTYTEDLSATTAETVYLGRTYPNPRDSPGSYMSPERFLPKFHLAAVRGKREASVALLCKCQSVVDSEPEFCMFAQEARAWLSTATVRQSDVDRYKAENWGWWANYDDCPYPACTPEVYYAALVNKVDLATWAARIDAIRRGVTQLPTVARGALLIKRCCVITGLTYHTDPCTCPTSQVLLTDFRATRAKTARTQARTSRKQFEGVRHKGRKHVSTK